MIQINKFISFRNKYKAFQYIPNPILVVDSEGFVKFANRSYKESKISPIETTKLPDRSTRIDTLFKLSDRDLKKIYDFLRTGKKFKRNILYVSLPSYNYYLKIYWAHADRYIIKVMDSDEIGAIQTGTTTMNIASRNEETYSASAYTPTLDENENSSIFQVLDSLDDLVHITDPNYVIHYMNPATKKIFGDAVGELCYRVFNDSNTPCQGCKLKLVIDGNSARYEVMLKRNGINYDIINSPIRMSDGSVYKISIMRDLKTIIDQHNKLKVFENAIEKSRNLISIFDSSGKIQYINNAFKMFFDVENADIKNKNIYDIVNFSPEHLEKKFNDFEIVFNKAGEKNTLRVFIYPLFSDEDIAASGTFVCIAHDITDIKNLEESLEKERNYFKSIIDNSTDAFFVINKKNQLVDCNYAFRMLFDISDNDIINRINVSYLFDKKSRVQFVKRVSSVFSTGKSENLELRVTRYDQKRYFLVSINHLFSEQGIKGRVFGFLKEITETTKLNNIIKKERNYNRSIIETVNLGFALLNEKNEYIDYNNAFLDLTGCTEKEIKGKTIFDFISPDFREEQIKIIQMISETGLPVIFENELIRTDRKKINVQVSMSRLVNPDGTFVGNFAFIRDITEQKEIDNELKRQNTRIIKLIDSYTKISTQFMKSDAISELITSIGKEIISIMKPDNIEIFLKEENRFTSQFSHDSFLKVHDINLSEKTSFIIQKLVNTREIIYIEDTLTELNDEDIEMLPGLKNYKSALFVPVKTNNTLSAIVVMAFISKPDNFDNILKSMLEGIANLASITIEKIRSLEEQESMQEALDRYEKLVAIGRIIAGVAHEINNPLSIMQLDLEELKDASEAAGNSTPEIIELITSLQDEIRRISGIVKQLKDYSKPASLQDDEIAIDEVLKTYPLKILLKNIQKKGIDIVMRLNAGKSKVLMPKTRIIQILMNILTNADDAIEEKSNGIIRINTGVLRKEGKYVTISVSDNGYGIEEDNLSKILEPFFTTKKKEGTGLGLSITYSIIKNYNGELKIESEPGVGSEFTVMLPLNDK